jgi:hypothetical protein
MYSAVLSVQRGVVCMPNSPMHTQDGSRFFALKKIGLDSRDGRSLQADLNTIENELKMMARFFIFQDVDFLS